METKKASFSSSASAALFPHQDTMSTIQGLNMSEFSTTVPCDVFVAVNQLLYTYDSTEDVRIQKWRKMCE